MYPGTLPSPHIMPIIKSFFTGTGTNLLPAPLSPHIAPPSGPRLLAPLPAPTRLPSLLNLLISVGDCRYRMLGDGRLLNFFNWT